MMQAGVPSVDFVLIFEWRGFVSVETESGCGVRGVVVAHDGGGANGLWIPIFLIAESWV